MHVAMEIYDLLTMYYYINFTRIGLAGSNSARYLKWPDVFSDKYTYGHRLGWVI